MLVGHVDDRLGNVFHGDAVDGREHAGDQREKQPLEQRELA